MTARNRTLYIREMSFDDILPNGETFMKKSSDGGGGFKVVIIGKPNTGKSTFISELIKSKKNIIPTGIVMNGTEANTGFYKKIIPELYVYNGYDESKVRDVLTRQKHAPKYLQNPWTMLLLDDCTEDPKILRSDVIYDIFKNGRHYNMLFVLALQYAMDILPAIRTCIDVAVIFRETREDVRKKLYTNYASVVGSFSVFCDVMDQITGNHTALVINNSIDSNDPEECVFFMRVSDLDQNFTFGSYEYQKHSKRELRAAAIAAQQQQVNARQPIASHH
jgi:hypothetical protein